jgi:hypothetical protein
MRIAVVGVNSPPNDVNLERRSLPKFCPLWVWFTDDRKKELMGAESFVTSADVGKRGARRARVLIAARLQSSLGELDCRLRDLSRMGALLECAQLPPIGSSVVFVRGKIAIAARVAWASEKRLGIEFEHPIDEQAVLVQLKNGHDHGIPEFYQRIGQSMTPKERKQVHSWSVAMGLNIPEAEG